MAKDPTAPREPVFPICVNVTVPAGLIALRRVTDESGITREVVTLARPSKRRRRRREKPT